ncbi:MAG: anti-sigma factor [Caldilineaceae bacterium]|nr:anti-sigma factor [Caldilineaceae bacterium]
MSDDLQANLNSSEGWTYDAVVGALPAFVLGALEPDEMLAVDAFLAQHPDLQARAAQLTETYAELALAVDPITPPPEVEAQIMARAEAAAAAQTAAAPSFPPRPAASTTAPRILNRPPVETSRRLGWGQRLRRFGPMALAGVGLAAVLLLLIINRLQLQSQAASLAAELQDAQMSLADAQDALAVLRVQTEELQQLNAELRGRLGEFEGQMANFAAADRVLALAGTDDAPDAHAFFALRGDQATLIAADLPAIAADQTFQLWLIPDGNAPVPSGLLPAQGGGVATWSTTVPLRADQFNLVGISVEPSGGSPAPTGPIVLLGG